MPALFRAAAVAILKNEAPYVAEWIEYHRLLGIEHFFLFDNGSADGLHAVLHPYLTGGTVTLLAWPDYPGQMSAYNYAIRMFGHACDWMTLIDLDEFIHLARPGTLADYWESLGDIDQVLMSWMLFGAGGHVTRPEGLVIQTYLKRLPEPGQPVKCAVRPTAVLSAEVHHCITRDGRTVDGNGRSVAEAWKLDRPAADVIRVNHYITRSREEWTMKLARGQADGTIWRREEEFLSYQGDTFDDATAQRGPEVRALLARTKTQAKPLHVSLPYSALSEVTPSRRWTRQAMRRFRAVADSTGGFPVWSLNLTVDRAVLHSPGRHLDQNLTEVLACRDGLAEDLKAQPGATGRFGRPYLFFHAEAEAATTLHLVTRGHDASGASYEHSCLLALEPGTSLGAAVLSSRTLSLTDLEIDWSGTALGGRMQSGTYSFL